MGQTSQGTSESVFTDFVTLFMLDKKKDALWSRVTTGGTEGIIKAPNGSGGGIVDNIECGLAGVFGGGREQSETPYRVNVRLSLWLLPELSCLEWGEDSIMRGRRGVLLEREDEREHLKPLKILALIYIVIHLLPLMMGLGLFC